jgi:hypothetical protein
LSASSSKGAVTQDIVKKKAPKAEIIHLRAMVPNRTGDNGAEEFRRGVRDV